MASWHTTETARDEWDTDLSDESLAELLDVAQGQVIAYASRTVRDRLTADEAPADGVPASYRLAQLRQAQNIHRAADGSPTGQTSEGEFTYTVYPLDWHIKNLIRPRKGTPTVG